MGVSSHTFQKMRLHPRAFVYCSLGLVLGFVLTTLLSLAGLLCPYSAHSDYDGVFGSPNRLIPLVEKGVLQNRVSFSSCVCGREAEEFQQAIESVTQKLLQLDSSPATMAEVKVIQQIMLGVLPEKATSRERQNARYASGKELARAISRRHRNATHASRNKQTRSWQRFNFREELLVAVAMGDGESGIDRMLTIQDSWGLDVSQTVFYVSASVAKAYREDMNFLANVVQIKDSDSSVTTPLAALHHIHTNFLDTYNWFLLAGNGSLYLHGWKLEEMLSCMDPEQEVYLGHPVVAIGKDSSLVHYCAGSSGIILSRAALRSLISSQGACPEVLGQVNGKGSTYTWSDYDKGLGQCMEKAMGITCANGEDEVCAG